MYSSNCLQLRITVPALCSTVLALAMLSGCGRSGEVTGTVRFDGDPLTAGRVTFFHSEQQGRNVSSHIQPDGSYRIPYCPTGPVIRWRYRNENHGGRR